MILSKTSEYALRSLIYLAAQPSGRPVLSRDISAYIGGSVPCVTKVLRWLAKRGVLESVKGKGGGYVLRPGAESLNIIDVIEITEGRPMEQRCVLGLNICTKKETRCPVHSQWEAIRNNELGFLKGQTVGAISRAMFWCDNAAVSV
jgi:Rrf2 family iron-sulfur cluster assembly transcriptional regulator